MQPHLPLTALVVAPLVLGACVRAYRPPTESEPHAILKVRRVYDEQPGESLRESLSVDGHRALSSLAPSGQVTAARNDVVMVHPQPATFRMESAFFHHELKSVQESYQERVPYTTMESYNCGTFQSRRTCMRTVTQYRFETKYRTVLKNVEVLDGACRGEVRFAPQVSGTYLLQYTYQGPTACRLTCFEQKPNANGELGQSPCPAPPPAK